VLEARPDERWRISGPRSGRLPGSQGEILGYLGPNGSGKSTTVNAVVGLLEPSAGSSRSTESRWQRIRSPTTPYRIRTEEPHLYAPDSGRV
jgi:ABC-2 type transport system ATP-binding protein